MAVTITKVGKSPNNTQFGLDTFTEHYKCDATADVVLTDGGVPQMLSAHPDYPSMFVTNRYVSETSESASHSRIKLQERNQLAKSARRHARAVEGFDIACLDALEVLGKRVEALAEETIRMS
jgi:hypothetical protein